MFPYIIKISIFAAALQILLTSETTAAAVHRRDGNARLTIFKDKACAESIIAFDETLVNPGCSLSFVQTFESIRLDGARSLSSITACQRGFQCDAPGANQIELISLGAVGRCITGNVGTQFDKIQYCL